MLIPHHRASAVLLVLSLASIPTSLRASDCSRVLDQIDTDARAFQTEAQKMGLDFARDEALSPALGRAHTALVEASPAAKAASDLQAAKERLEGWQRRVGAWKTGLADLKLCLEYPNQCNLQAMLQQVNADLRAWLQSIGTDDLAAAAERVEKASGLLESYSSRLAGAAEANIGSAVSCLEQRPAGQASAKTPVDLQTPSTAPQAAKAKAGPSGGAKAAIALVAVAGAVGAGVALGNAAAESVDSSATSSCPDASQLAAMAGGGIVAVGNSGICTQWIACGDKSATNVRSCAANICNPASCSIYYEFGGGGKVVCLTGCDASRNQQQVTSAIMSCATRAAAACQ